jgi:predicted RNase H-like HicB family nuclease
VERVVTIHIEKLPEGLYLATSDEIQGLVAQGRTVQETLEIARDVTRKLLEAQAGRSSQTKLMAVADTFDYPLVVGS